MRACVRTYEREYECVFDRPSSTSYLCAVAVFKHGQRDINTHEYRVVYYNIVVLIRR